MHKKFLAHFLTIAVIAASLAACASPGTYRPNTQVSRDCTNGSVLVEIRYGDSHLQVTPRANLKRNAGVKFVLKPKQNEQAHSKNGSKATNDLEVLIKGEKFVPDSGATGDTSVTWLDKSGTAGPPPHTDLIACAKPNQAQGTYYYSVEVEHVGKLDPRADVKD